MSVEEDMNFGEISTLMLRKSEQQLYCNHVAYNDQKWRQGLIPQRKAVFYSNGQEMLPWDQLSKCELYGRKPQYLPPLSTLQNEFELWDNLPPPAKNPCDPNCTRYPMFDAVTRSKTMLTHSQVKPKLEDLCGDCGNHLHTSSSYLL